MVYIAPARHCSATRIHLSLLDLVQPFSTDKFNRLGRLNRIIQCYGINEDEQVARIEQVIDHLTNVFVKHGMHDLLGVSLVHNHFQLNDGEIVQTAIKPIRTNSNISACMGEGLMEAATNKHAFYTETVSSASSSSIAIPYMWAYDKEAKQYFPMQYFDGTNVQMQQRLAELGGRVNFPSFLHEYQKELEKYGLESDLGFFLHYQNLVESDQENQVFYEITNNQSRQQVLFVTPKDGVNELMKNLGHGCVRNTHWTIQQKPDGTIDKVVGGCICGIDC